MCTSPIRRPSAGTDGTVQGSIGKIYEALRERIVFASAMVEAIIDFGEGEEIEDGVWEKGKSWRRLLNSGTRY